MTYDRNALLELIQQGALVEVEGRTAHDEAGLDFLLSIAVSDEPSEEALKGHEDEITLTPGSALYSPDGLLPPIGEGPKWCVPGDFQLYLEPSDAEQADGKLVREILVGSWREPSDDDFEFAQGCFLDDSLWDSVVGAAQREALRLDQQIGKLAEGVHPDERLPRAETWLAERANWQTEVEQLRGYIAMLEGKLSAATELPRADSAPPASETDPIVESPPIAEPAPAKAKGK